MSLVKKHRLAGWLYCIVVVLIVSGCSKSKETVARFVYKKDCSGLSSCQVVFTNQSQYADSYQWIFGDGETSTEVNPVHFYSRANAYYIVKLKAINVSEAREIFFEDTVFLNEKPACENISSFDCVKRLESNATVDDNLLANKNNYYYFVTPKPGAVKIKLSPVPSGSHLYVELLSEARDNSPVLKTAYGYPGETISYFAGPLSKDTFYIRLKSYDSGPESYSLTYSFIYTDSFEVNNSFDKATPLVFDIPRTGTMLSTTDIDYYSFYLNSAGVVDITLRPIPDLGAGGILTLQVFEEASSNSSLGYRYGYSGETINYSIGPLDSGTHYILVKTNGHESTEQYKLTIRKDVSDEYEINNSFSKATLVPDSRHIHATLKAAGDLDYYKYTAISDGPATIHIDRVPLGISRMYVEMFNSANSSDRLESKIGESGNEINFITSKPLVKGKEYFFKISSYYSNEESNQTYTLRIIQQP